MVAARATALAMFAAVKREIGALEAVRAWLTVDGYVNASAGYAHTTAVFNPFSESVLDVFGAERGAHARTAIGVEALPLNLPVVVRAQLRYSVLGVPPRTRSLARSAALPHGA